MENNEALFFITTRESTAGEKSAPSEHAPHLLLLWEGVKVISPAEASKSSSDCASVGPVGKEWWNVSRFLRDTRAPSGIHDPTETGRRRDASSARLTRDLLQKRSGTRLRQGLRLLLVHDWGHNEILNFLRWLWSEMCFQGLPMPDRRRLGVDAGKMHTKARCCNRCTSKTDTVTKTVWAVCKVVLHEALWKYTLDLINKRDFLFYQNKFLKKFNQIHLLEKHNVTLDNKTRLT